MSVSVSMRQTTVSLDGPLYRVKNEVTAATGISSALFVFKTANDLFDHYASVADIARWPDNKTDAIAQQKGFYRLASVQRDWPTVDLMNEDLQVSVESVQSVVDEWNAAATTVGLDRTVTLTSGA